MSVRMTKQELQWRTESDAHTLIEAEEIRGDSDRLERAKNMAKEMVEQKKAQLEAAKKAAEMDYDKMPEQKL